MIRRHPVVALLAAGVLAVVAASGSARTEPALAPAPPPALCRLAPDGGWASVPDDGPVADLTAYQDYRTELGLGADATGAHVTVADVEYSWRPGHLELRARGLADPPANSLPDSFRAADHGTAVLGLLAGTADGQGVTGLVTGAGIRPVSPYASGSYDPAGAVTAAAAGLGPGDVLLVELQAIGPDSSLVPIEYVPGVRVAIRRAVDAGIVVVEPAGNGDLNLGGLGRPWLTAPDAANASGALIVGAGGSPTDATGASDLRRVSGSNFGARVDVQGVGAAVVTSGYSDGIGGIGDRAYTSCFDGTSSATATVAAAVAALQSGAIARRGTPLTPAQLRALLRMTGAPQVAPETGAIGPRPQIDAALAWLAGAAPPTDPGTTPATPATPVTPPAVAGGGLTPAPPAVTPAMLPRAARGAVATFSRRAGRLVIRLRGLVAGSRVTVAGLRRKAVAGRIVVLGVRPGRMRLLVAPPARLRATTRPFTAVVVIPARGPARVLIR